MINSAKKFLELMGIGVFNADGTPKYMSELINEIKSGEKTPNQVRKEHGLPPIEGGDQYYHKKL
ncbi:hypothetical protein GKD08_04755 [Paeniclostridium sordellii]|uniref:hypothetical protein n=1 Tax=Paraclostridium sordellii TaxID=1505 RepID=UPI0012B0090C|nr:hypothetical protein [Paeniclostridium sordellii]MRZ28072.1 hypothetical protein [Paeniclostridium sordellii]